MCDCSDYTDSYGIYLTNYLKLFTLYLNCRAVRRGTRITEKYLKEQTDVEKLKITDTDLTGRNIFHLSVQREELLEFVLGNFEKV